MVASHVIQSVAIRLPRCGLRFDPAEQIRSHVGVQLAGATPVGNVLSHAIELLCVTRNLARFLCRICIHAVQLARQKPQSIHCMGIGSRKVMGAKHVFNFSGNSQNFFRGFHVG